MHVFDWQGLIKAMSKIFLKDHLTSMHLYVLIYHIVYKQHSNIVQSSWLKDHMVTHCIVFNDEINNNFLKTFAQNVALTN